MEAFPEKNQEDVGTAEDWSEGQGQTTSEKPTPVFGRLGWGRVFFICERVTLRRELGALCVPVKPPGVH